LELLSTGTYAQKGKRAAQPGGDGEFLWDCVEGVHPGFSVALVEGSQAQGMSL
jgi:hypothetical protein